MSRRWYLHLKYRETLFELIREQLIFVDNSLLIFSAILIDFFLFFFFLSNISNKRRPPIVEIEMDYQVIRIFQNYLSNALNLFNYYTPCIIHLYQITSLNKEKEKKINKFATLFIRDCFRKFSRSIQTRRKLYHVKCHEVQRAKPRSSESEETLVPFHRNIAVSRSRRVRVAVAASFIKKTLEGCLF